MMKLSAMSIFSSTVQRTATLVALCVALSTTAYAQSSAPNVRTLTIQNGVVYVDGRAVSSALLPDSLNIQGIEAHYQFVGIQQPVVELDGRLYAVGSRLIPVTEAQVRAHEAAVIVRSPRPSMVERAVAPRSVGTNAQQSYLQAMQRKSQTLYQQLLRERSLEAQALEYARAIRLMAPSPTRAQQIDSLRAMLRDIFALKQANRRREIEQIQQQLAELQRQLQRREAMKEAMIDHRLEQLLGPVYNAPDAPPRERR
ncbi:hypothetical protein [Salisaeta longa]|uniref:hypothetical protein n=1 Tax=Salisaeta longa TaxID=503170 RepID=UPI00042019BD|nr:hypothetical protein [Salisaeta longa]